MADPGDAKATRAISERGQRRREAIMAAATREFLENGFEGASVRTIIRDAGGSADAVYRQFGSKAGLFRAVIERLMQTHYESHFGPESLDRPVREELLEFGRDYMATVLGDGALRFYRMMIAESAVVPEMAEVFWESGPGYVARQLEAYLRKQDAAGAIRVADPELAATQFMELAKGGMHIRLLCTGNRPDPAELERRLRAAVDLFLKGIAP